MKKIICIILGILFAIFLIIPIISAFAMMEAEDWAFIIVAIFFIIISFIVKGKIV